jgi:hypothetical protein
MSECLDEIHRAALYVRDKYSIPNNVIVTPEFEKEFSVKIIYADDIGLGGCIEFKSEAHYSFFLLKWS